MERLFQASPSYRRNFIDRLIFSSKNDYNRLINKYKKFLFERIKIRLSILAKSLGFNSDLIYDQSYWLAFNGNIDKSKIKVTKWQNLFR